jgi:hypothetical protein
MTMPEQLETALRDAFASRAANIPADSSIRLRSVDYRPRLGRVTPRLTLGALAGAAATSGAIVSVVVFGGAQAAFAGWSAAPTAATSGQTATADTQCQSRLSSLSTPSGSIVTGGWTPVVTDVRGPFTVVIFQDGTATANCFTGPSFTLVSASTGFGPGSTQEGEMSSSASAGTSGPHTGSVGTSLGTSADSIGGGVGHFTTAHLQTSAGDAYTLAEGQIDSTVTGITLQRSDGSSVEATVENGWFVAWWPGDQSVSSVQVTTAAGTTTQPVQIPASPAGQEPSTNSVGGQPGTGTSSGTSTGPSTSSSGSGA